MHVSSQYAMHICFCCIMCAAPHADKGYNDGLTPHTQSLASSRTTTLRTNMRASGGGQRQWRRPYEDDDDDDGADCGCPAAKYALAAAILTAAAWMIYSVC